MKSEWIKQNMQESIIRTIVQRNIQYISDIKDIPWETDKYQKENKDDNNQYTYYQHILFYSFTLHYLHNNVCKREF
jgi:hypothetical protein